MYNRNTQGWLKHIDFILLDEICLQVAFILAYYIRHLRWPYAVSLYQRMGIALAVLDFAVLILFNTMHNVLKRGPLEELVKTIQHCFLVFALITVYMFAFQSGVDYSRITVFLTAIFHSAFGYIVRLIWKQIVMRYGLTMDRKDSMLVILQPETADQIMERLMRSNLEGYRIVGAVCTEPTDRSEIGGVPVVAEIGGAANYICQKWIDSVYIDASLQDENVTELIDACHEMAVPVHYHVASIGRDGVKQFAEKIGGTTVLTTSVNYATSGQLIMKRVLDIIGGLIGSILAILIMIVVGPIIKIKSPGPILYSQERIGRNGKRFRILKIRSMYVNADEEKQKLMEQNRVKDGMMFKMEFDPRIIGNRILPDGTKKTGIGEFIRRTSLDEFPQFFNVLAGQMSLVGTRPPTVDEWEKYEFHHRARLSCKPGITGMWQVSGRSEITDFEEVVKLDTEYISNWSMALDIKILFKTIGVLVTGRGAM